MRYLKINRRTIGTKQRTNLLTETLLRTTMYGFELKQLRETRSLTLDALASKAELPRQYLERLENGEIYPKASVRHKLDKALKHHRIDSGDKKVSDTRFPLK